MESLETMRNMLSENNYPLEYDAETWRKCLRANCYVYALGLEIDEGLLIGDIIGKRVTTNDSMQKHVDVLREELEFLGFYVDTCDTLDVVDEGCLKIFIEWNENNEYHLYRQDIDGRWSHKAAGNYPTQFDSDGCFIYDPEEFAQIGRCFIISNF